MPDKQSFDEIVELISTGQADKIPGIKDIPLKINDEKPSVASMQRPMKPWEVQGSVSRSGEEEHAQKQSMTKSAEQ